MGNSICQNLKDDSLTEETDQRDQEEGNSKIYYHSRSSTNIGSLPDELVFDILLHVPAQDIYNGARLVCKKWYRMIRNRNFIDQHLRHSTHALVIHCVDHVNQRIVVSMRRGRIEISKFKYYQFKRSCWSGCDGLFLHCDPGCRDGYIINPATNRHFPLPPSVTPTCHSTYPSIAYDSASMVYKVVLNQNCFGNHEGRRHCVILTVGVDKSWRHVDTKHLSHASRELLSWTIPLTIEGFIHWTDKPQGTDHRVVTLNVETEVITETCVPVDYGYKYYLSTGTSLTLLIECGEFSWEFWNFKPETGEWTKTLNIDLEPQRGKLENWVSKECRRCLCSFNLKPVGWLNHGEVLVLHGSRFTRVCILYNVHTQAIDFFELVYECSSHIFNSYRNSLVSLA